MKKLTNEQKLEAYENATHRLKCKHCIGRNCTTYYMHCNIIKKMPDGRLKVVVYGNLYWGMSNAGNNVNIRYVPSNRVFCKSEFY